MAAPKGNKFALGNQGGRPPKYDNPIELEAKCIEYFTKCIEDEEKATITGLTLFLGFCERSSLDNYARKEEFSHLIKRAKLTVENSYELSGSTFDMFALKNMGWKDKTEVESTNINYNAEVTKEEVKEINDALEDEC
jgi:hypothetical protein